MRNIILTCLLVLLGTGAFAQTTAGSISLRGSFTLYSGSSNSNTSDSNGAMFSISPSAGYFIKDGLELGFGTRLGFGTNTTKGEGSTIEHKTNSFDFAIGPYLTKYIPITEKLHFTATGSLGYEGSRVKNPDLDKKLLSTSSGYYVAAAPGLTYFATPKLGFSAFIGYVGYSKSTLTEETEPKQKTTNSSFRFDFSPATVSLGIGYYINR